MKKIIIPILMIILLAPTVFGAFLVAEFADSTVGYYDGEEIFKFQVPDGPNKIALTSDNKRAVVTSSVGHAITILDISNRKVLTSLDVKDVEPFGVVITNDDKYALVTNIDKGSVSVVDLEALKIIKTIIVDDSPTNIAVTKDNKFAYVTNLGSSSVTIIDLNLMKPIKKIQNPNIIRSPAMITIGKDNAYFFNTRLNVLKAINLEQQTLLNLELPAANTNINNDMKIITDFAILTGAVGDEGVVQIIDLVDKSILKDISLGTTLYGIDYDRGNAYVTTAENEVFVVDVKTDQFERINVGAKPRGIAILKEMSEMPAVMEDDMGEAEEKKSFLIPILIIIAVVFIIPWIFRPKVFDEEPKVVKPKKVEILKNDAKKETKNAKAKKVATPKKETKKEEVKLKTETKENEKETKEVKPKVTKAASKEETKVEKKPKETKKVAKKKETKKKASEDDDWIDMEEISDDEWEKMINEN